MIGKTKELEKIFEEANKNFLKRNSMLFEMQVSERTLCGALMIELYEMIKGTRYSSYFVDVEYNRNIGGKLKTMSKTIKGPTEEIITINCDLIVHSRGQNRKQDNLIAIEMKKSTAKKSAKDSDRVRLKCLTTKNYDSVYSDEEKISPEHVCGYGLGIYYEVDFRQNKILLEYYSEGCCYQQVEMPIY